MTFAALVVPLKCVESLHEYSCEGIYGGGRFMRFLHRFHVESRGRCLGGERDGYNHQVQMARLKMAYDG